MNMVNASVKAELMKMAYEVQKTAAVYGAAYEGHGTASIPKEAMDQAMKKLTEMVEKL